MNLKILIFYIAKNSGHFIAAQSIEKALKRIHSKIDIFSLDCFNYTNPVLSKIIYSSYSSLLKTKPEVWKYLYDNPKIVKKLQKFKELVHKYNSTKLENLLKDYNPDVIVTTQAFPCGLVSDYKSSNEKNIPLIAVLTDYYPHSFWLYEEVDKYVVPSQEAKSRLIKEGIVESRIENHGIPISPDFYDKKDNNLLKSKFGLEEGIPTVLIMGGSQGFGPLKKITLSLDKLELNFQIMVTTGFNDRLKKYLQKKIHTLNHTMKVLGYVDDISGLMEISDILITKPGGLTTTEATAKELPMVIFNPIPGQEKNNTRFLLQRGMTLKAADPEEAGILVKELITNRAKYNQMKKTLQKQDFSNPSMKIANLILKLGESYKYK